MSSSGLEKRSLEKWLQLRLGNTPKWLTFRRLNEDISPIASEDQPFLWWEVG